MTTGCACGSGVSLYQNRDRTIRVKVAGPGDLTGAKVWFTVKGDQSDEDDDALITKKSANLVGGSDAQAKVVDGYVKDTTVGSETYGLWVGIVEIYIVPDDTELIEPGDYWYDVVVENASGRKFQAIGPSRFGIEQTVTKT